MRARRVSSRLVWPTLTLQVRRGASLFFADELACRGPDVCELRAKVSRGAACVPLLVTAVFTSASNAERNGTVELRPLLFSQVGLKGCGGEARCFREIPSK